MVVIEDFNRHVKGAPKLFVQATHDERAHIFVMYALDDAVLEGVAEGAMPHVVEQDGQACAFRFFLRDGHPFVAQAVNGFLHEVHAANGVVKTVVDGAWIDQMRQPKVGRCASTAA